MSACSLGINGFKPVWKLETSDSSFLRSGAWHCHGRLPSPGHREENLVTAPRLWRVAQGPALCLLGKGSPVKVPDCETGARRGLWERRAGREGREGGVCSHIALATSLRPDDPRRKCSMMSCKLTQQTQHFPHIGSTQSRPL